MRASLVIHDRVDFIDDHRCGRLQNPAAAFRGEEDEQRLGRRDQNVRRPFDHFLPLGHWRVAGS